MVNLKMKEDEAEMWWFQEFVQFPQGKGIAVAGAVLRSYPEIARALNEAAQNGAFVKIATSMGGDRTLINMPLYKTLENQNDKISDFVWTKSDLVNAFKKETIVGVIESAASMQEMLRSSGVFVVSGGGFKHALNAPSA